MKIVLAVNSCKSGHNYYSRPVKIYKLSFFFPVSMSNINSGISYKFNGISYKFNAILQCLCQDKDHPLQFWPVPSILASVIFDIKIKHTQHTLPAVYSRSRESFRLFNGGKYMLGLVLTQTIPSFSCHSVLSPIHSLE